MSSDPNNPNLPSPQPTPTFTSADYDKIASASGSLGWTSTQAAAVVALMTPSQSLTLLRFLLDLIESEEGG